ncbi:MAG: hypothetical protein D6820_07995, partial [Lentisphaerae bacterium]
VATVELLAEAVRQHSRREQFITTNHQPWNPRSDYFDMNRHLDISGTNYYPAFGSRSRKISLGLTACRSYQHKNFQVHELRNSAHMVPGEDGNQPAPGEVTRLTFHAIGNGANGIFYFRWRACPFGCEQTHGTITDYDGRPRRIYPEIQSIGVRLRRLSPCLEEATVESDIALLYDFEARWAAEVKSRWNGPANLFMDRQHLLHRCIRQLGYNCDLVSPTQDFSRYRLIIVPMLPVIRDETVAKLLAWQEAGGTLLWHPLCGLKDAESIIYPDRIHPDLRAAWGVTLQEYLSIGPHDPVKIVWNGKEYGAELFADCLELPADGIEEARLLHPDFPPYPGIYQKPVKKGRLIYFAAFAEESLYQDYLSWLLPQVGIAPILPGPLPPEIEICERRNDRERFVFLINHSKSEQHLALPMPATDIYHEEELERGPVHLSPHGVRILRFPL